MGLDGEGNGPLHQTSVQVPALIKVSLHFKQAVVVGDGQGVRPCSSTFQIESSNTAKPDVELHPH